MNYELTLKVHVENLTQGQCHGPTRKGHGAYQSTNIVKLNTCKVFSSLSQVSIQGYCRTASADLA